MNLKTTEQAMTDLFLAFGRVPEDRLRLYLTTVRDRAGCTACLLTALEEAPVAFERMPSIRQILGLYWAEHNDHTPNLPYTEPEPYNGPIGKAASPADDDIRDELERGLWG